MVAQERPYQKECRQAVLKALETHQSAAFVMPTATGKTFTFLNIVKGARALVVVHRDFLCNQTKAEYDAKILPSLPDDKQHLSFSIRNGKRKLGDAKHSVVANVQWLNAKKGANQNSLGAFDYVVFDEAHHGVTDTYKAVKERALLLNPDCKFVYTTATPQRADNKPLRDVCDTLAYFKPINWFVRNGYLSQVKSFSFQCDIETSKLKESRATGDFVDNLDLRAAIDASDWLDVTVAAYKEHAYGKRAIVFCLGVDNSKKLCQAFNDAGIIAAHIDANTKQDERDRLLNAYKAGHIWVLCNDSIFTEGFDAPAIECVIMAQPTKSQLAYIQRVGRGLRLFEGKEYLIVLDMTDSQHTLTQFGDIDPVYIPESQRNLLSLAGFGSGFIDRYLLSLSARRGLVQFGESKDTFARLTNLLRNTKIAWAAFDERAIMVSSKGTLLFLPPNDASKIGVNEAAKDDCYSLLMLERNNHESQQLLGQYEDLDRAMEYAIDIAEEYADLLSASDAMWRFNPPTQKQIRLLVEFLGADRNALEGINRGQATLMIDYLKSCFALGLCVGHGFDEAKEKIELARKIEAEQRKAASQREYELKQEKRELERNEAIKLAHSKLSIVGETGDLPFLPSASNKEWMLDLVKCYQNKADLSEREREFVTDKMLNVILWENKSSISSAQDVWLSKIKSKIEKVNDGSESMQSKLDRLAMLRKKAGY